MSNFFNVQSSIIQSTLGYYLLGMSLSQVVYGSLSDKFGRKAILLFGVFIYITASITATFATDVSTL
jgi:DHA1 family bicyclomycin/chloramphenicol resistance-like MFS transporter